MEKDDITGTKLVREFKLTTLSLKNKNTVILITILLALFGILAYKNMPLELFPEVNMPYIFVKTVYPGNSPLDMENLITRHLEKEIKTINGIKEMRSVSSQDNSDIFIEFNTDVVIGDALQDVKDAVDQAKSELPNDLDMDPMAMDLDLNEFPIINVNLSGDFSLDELKDYAEHLEDEIETIPEVSKVEIKGINERQIRIDVDPHKLEANGLSFGDIENAVTSENISIAGGEVVVDKTTRSIRTVGEFKNLEELENIIIKQEEGKDIVYLKDVAQVVDGFEDPLTYARLNKQAVVSLQVIKKARENLVNAVDKIVILLAHAQKENVLPSNLNVSLSNDQSEYVRSMVSDLENNIYMGVIFVVGILFLFLGLRNALFVGLAIPMSMFISFIVLGLMGHTLNMMVLFGLVLALGMLVDNGIVVVENITRFVQNGYSLYEAAKNAVGEIAFPIISSTATTLAAFFPLIFWKDIMGEFMKNLPITLIVSLTASLFVALVINPVMAANFILRDEDKKSPTKKKSFRTAAILLGVGIFFYIVGIPFFGTIFVILALLVVMHYFFLYRLAEWFQTVFLVKLENSYLQLLRFALRKKNPRNIIWGFIGLFIVTMVFFGIRQPKVTLFPINQPSFINVFVELPVGTDIGATNEMMYKVEDRIYTGLKRYRHIVKSILTTIGKGSVGENETAVGNTPNKGMTTITFVDYQYRGGINTSTIMKEIGDDLIGRYPGVQVQVVKNEMGPPTGKPINIEISGKEYDRLIPLAQDIQEHLESFKVKGVEGFRLDVDTGSPEMIVEVDRDGARRFGLSTAQIASTIRTALFGKEISDFKEGEDDYPIVLRLKKEYRDNISALLNQKIAFRSQNTGKLMQIPISAAARFKYNTTFAAVNRLDMDKVITLWSNVLEGNNPTEVNIELQERMEKYKMPEGYTYKFTGEQKEQQETSAYLMRALLIAIALIMLILVTQFNSFSKPLIIMATVFFSTIGVFGGLAAFKMDFVIIMTGIGIISLAGVVVNNAIVLIDYIDFLKANAKKRMGLKQDDQLPIKESMECIVQAGRTRLRPVLLTAITTVLGLVPMAIGLNFNFNTFFSRFDPQIYFGGDNALFWGPMAWTVIFGLTFATLLTLVVIPAMYLIGNRIKLAFLERFEK